MAENCSHDCSSCGEDCPSREGASLKKKPYAMSDIKRVIAVVSGKGGVGKSLLPSMMAVAQLFNGRRGVAARLERRFERLRRQRATLPP